MDSYCSEECREAHTEKIEARKEEKRRVKRRRKGM